jgi:hypothetical protein
LIAAEREIAGAERQNLENFCGFVRGLPVAVSWVCRDYTVHVKVCQTYVTPSCKKLNKVSLGESHFNGRIGKLLYFRL